MLPVVAAAAAGTSATALWLSKRKQRQASKPQRRFKHVLADNSDTPFTHLASISPAAGQPADSHPLSENSPPSPAVDHTGSNADQQEQQQRHDLAGQEQQHPYAAHITVILQHPRCPDFSTVPSNSASSSISTTISTSSAHSTTKQPGSPACQSQELQLASQVVSAAAGSFRGSGFSPQEPLPLSQTPAVWVDTPKKLQGMLQQLQGVKCLALDTEHNSQRSYLGMLCLLQLSTGTVDYLVDALALHDQLPLLRPLMADPAVLKVLHGGANDIGWLQRDAHVYLVNVFDTERAAQVLGREERSLAHLLRRYCGVVQDKSHQTADWRVRPLPPALVQYARADVHWLVCLAGLMVAEMQARSPSTTGDSLAPGPLLTSALQKSNSQTLKLYHKTPAAVSISNATAAAMRRYMQQKRRQQQQQSQPLKQPVTRAAGQHVVAAAAVALPAATGTGSSTAAGAEATGELHFMLVAQRLATLVAWRDSAARADDEGPQYILPDAALLELVDCPPQTAKQLLSVVKKHCDTLNAATQHLPAAPKWQPSSAVKKAAKQLLHLLQDADQLAAVGTDSGSGQGKHAGVAAAAAAAAVGAGVDAAGSSSAGGGGLAAAGLMVNGKLVPKGAGQQLERQQQQQRQGQRKSDVEFRQRLIKKFSAKTQVYDNCRMLATTGELLCYCDARKLHWYLDKGLAELVAEEPPTIRLLFEHKNADQQMGLDGFYSTSRANRCVVCGCEEHYLRYRVVPACYRRCFPAHLKSHRSHDIVLLCVDCHQVAHKAAERVKRDVAAHYNVPLQPTYEHLLHTTPATACTAAEVADTNAPNCEPFSAAFDSDHNTAQHAAEAEAEAEDAAAAAAAAAAELEEDAEASEAFLSSYHKGSPRPVSGLMLAHQARAAAIALVKFGDDIPAARKQQLEGLVARFLGRDAAAADAAGTPLVTLADLEHTMLVGLGQRKQAKALKKLHKNLKQLQAAEESASEQQLPPAVTPAAAGGDLDDSAAAGDGSGSGAAGAAEATSAAVESSSSSNVAGVTGISQGGSRVEQLLTEGRGPKEQGHIWHGQQVVAAALARGGEEELHQLVRRFRQVFVVATKPKYLPANWAVDAVDRRQFGEHSVYAREEAAAAAAGKQGPGGRRGQGAGSATDPADGPDGVNTEAAVQPSSRSSGNGVECSGDQPAAAAAAVASGGGGGDDGGDCIGDCAAAAASPVELQIGAGPSGAGGNASGLPAAALDELSIFAHKHAAVQ